jgi:hypothetical protein
MSETGPLADLYRATDDEMIQFGEQWSGPEVYEHGVEYLLADYPGEKFVRVYGCALPARFYELLTDGVSIQFPSGRLVQCAEMAREIADGTLVIKLL